MLDPMAKAHLNWCEDVCQSLQAARNSNTEKCKLPALFCPGIASDKTWENTLSFFNTFSLPLTRDAVNNCPVTAVWKFAIEFNLDCHITLTKLSTENWAAMGAGEVGDSFRACKVPVGLYSISFCQLESRKEKKFSILYFNVHQNVGEIVRNQSAFYLLQPYFSSVCPCLIFTACKMEIMVPTSSVEVSGVLVEAVIIFQEYFLILMLSSGNKLYFLMVGVKVLCRVISAVLNVPLCLFAGFYIFCICMQRQSGTTGGKMTFENSCFKTFLVFLLIWAKKNRFFFWKMLFCSWYLLHWLSILIILSSTCGSL